MKNIFYLFLCISSNVSFSQKNITNQLWRKNYLVTKNFDTISENIKIKKGSIKPFKFINLPDSISKKDIISFRKDGYQYYYKKKRRVAFFDKKFAFLKLLEKGEVNLYEYITKEINSTSAGTSEVIHYYIERNNAIHLVLSSRFYQIILRVLPDNKELIKKIRKREYNYFDIVKVIKEFNNSQKK